MKNGDDLNSRVKKLNNDLQKLDTSINTPLKEKDSDLQFYLGCAALALGSVTTFANSRQQEKPADRAVGMTLGASLAAGGSVLIAKSLFKKDTISNEPSEKLNSNRTFTK